MKRPVKAFSLVVSIIVVPACLLGDITYELKTTTVAEKNGKKLPPEIEATIFSIKGALMRQVVRLPEYAAKRNLSFIFDLGHKSKIAVLHTKTGQGVYARAVFTNPGPVLWRPRSSYAEGTATETGQTKRCAFR